MTESDRVRPILGAKIGGIWTLWIISHAKVTIEAQLGLIGGTMGLLTGFSILSGVEIVYFLIKLIVSLVQFRD